MKLRALVVDDSRVMRAMVMDVLNKSHLADFDFTEAGDGDEALKKFNPKQIDIIFADWNMPNMSGIDLVRQIRSMDGTAHIPIVMVTSEKTMGKMEEALDQGGANAFITKPFTVEYLQKKIGPLIAELEHHKPKGGFGGLFGRQVRASG